MAYPCLEHTIPEAKANQQPSYSPLIYEGELSVYRVTRDELGSVVGSVQVGAVRGRGHLEASNGDKTAMAAPVWFI